MQGGCVSISSLGGIGGTHFTPIINAPGGGHPRALSKGQMKPVWDGKQFVPRLMLPLSLSYDHRVIDGAPGRALQRLPGPGAGGLPPSPARWVPPLFPLRAPPEMTTVVAVRKAARSLMAADTLVTFGDTRACRTAPRPTARSSPSPDAPDRALFAVGAGLRAHFPVLRQALAAQPREAAAVGQQATRSSAPSPACIRC